MAVNTDAARTLDCGKTLEQLADYLAADRLPPDPHIESCPECLTALQALTGVAQLSRDLVERDASELPAPSEAWVSAIMNHIRLDVRAGRSLPLHHDDPWVTATVSEGAVRGLIRSVGDHIDGLLVGRTDILGEAETPHMPVRLHITVSVAWAESAPPLIDVLRLRVTDALRQHTQLNLTGIDVTVEDVHGHPAEGSEPR